MNDMFIRLRRYDEMGETLSSTAIKLQGIDNAIAKMAF